MNNNFMETFFLANYIIFNCCNDLLYCILTSQVVTVVFKISTNTSTNYSAIMAKHDHTKVDFLTFSLPE